MHSATFTYDALGRRVSKTINGVTTEYLYDGNDIVAEIQSGAMMATYLRSLNIDEPFVRFTATGAEYYHTDALGSVIALTDSSGTTTTTYRYDPFGSTVITGTSTNPFQYTGREDDGTGLYYYRARYYSPSLHRFLSEDPLNLSRLQLLQQRGSSEAAILFLYLQDNPALLNAYPYVANSPLSWRDPYGLIGPGGGTALGCALGGASGSSGGRKGKVVGTVLGCTFAPLIYVVPSGPTGAVVGGLVGAVTGAATGGAKGDLGDMALGALAGGIGGAIGGAIGGGRGAIIGTVTAIVVDKRIRDIID